MVHEKRTIEEAITYFKQLADSYEKCAHVTNDVLKKEYYSAKADAYEVAAFELEHNVL